MSSNSIRINRYRFYEGQLIVEQETKFIGRIIKLENNGTAEVHMNYGGDITTKLDNWKPLR